MLDQRRTTNILLLVIVIPLIFYLLKLLSFIFIPLIASMFIALLFLPLMRWLGRRNVPRFVSILIVVALIVIGVMIGVELVQLSSRQILSNNEAFLGKAELKINDLMYYLQDKFGLDYNTEGNFFTQFLERENIGSTFDFVRKFVTNVLMMTFFTILWLSESINMHKVMNNTILKQKHTSIKAFMKIERDLITFIKVKFLVSLLTGIFTGLACVFFDVSFPIFWGLFAFLINFVQMVGSFISVILLSIFAFVELDPTSTLFFFIVTISGVQVLFGAILEPIFMGKSFSINVITVLIMLMLWGFIWGIPGLIMAIPITVFMKIILEQFPGTKVIASLLSGPERGVKSAK
ncbi:AI-2E family transporter [Psychroserpens sp.]|uniref:AI-2E family transporter n=1 Tax=Psychroserpens sp. TaxID=2020870 RepID=UPI001B23FA70|nr:AI-2E family transporter [Psychroserpens sp.]MBO6607251.1 AI-2E family transporter [Psychroserpens sp.]MBO6631481.1 AI-2E family transporter [Psychroserpens sp.]MBO6654397.1 AI-2E family transporter [Psychroserpens sp.]MBO6682317.1 AI-2E family transporter [Psychroserpens sp.]MBO6751023.1 AI-2E family transporter [Psychroserpens sp.]